MRVSACSSDFGVCEFMIYLYFNNTGLLIGMHREAAQNFGRKMTDKCGNEDS